jgi:hypothetical protein
MKQPDMPTRQFEAICRFLTGNRCETGVAGRAVTTRDPRKVFDSHAAGAKSAGHQCGSTINDLLGMGAESAFRHDNCSAVGGDWRPRRSAAARILTSAEPTLHRAASRA